MTVSRIIARCVLMLAGAAASTVTLAQVIAPSAAASAAADRAQKETDRTMYWIRVLAQTPAPRPAAPKPPVAPAAPVAAAAPAPARQTKVAAAAPERVKVASGTTASAPAQTSADNANAATSSVVVAAVPEAAAPSLAAATGTASTGNASALGSGGVDAGGVSGAGLAGALAAPAAVAPQIDVPVAEEEPDPGLVMIKSADPDFPAATMRRLRKGQVEVKFEVNADGIVDVVTVVKTSHASLNAAAVEAVRQWRFKPTPRGHTAEVDLAFDMDS